jgi:hypothetical protein
MPGAKIWSNLDANLTEISSAQSQFGQKNSFAGSNRLLATLVLLRPQIYNEYNTFVNPYFMKRRNELL